MSFKVSSQQLKSLFNPDWIHRGVSLQKLAALGKIQGLQKKLRTSFQKGIANTVHDHQQRIKHFGSNQPITRNPKPFLDLMHQNMEDQLIKLMIVAGLFSLALGVLTQGLKWGWLESFYIFFAVLLVVSLTSLDDYVHQHQFEQIKGKQNGKRNSVYRAGKIYQLHPSQLLVGDIIQIMGGEILQVDGVLVSGANLLVDQSQITGDTVQIKKKVPVTYDRKQAADPFLLSSSQIVSGSGTIMVLAVGRNSYYGGLLTQAMNDDHDSPLKRRLSQLSNQINDSSLIMGVITFSSLIIHYLYQCFKTDNPWRAILSSETMHKIVQSILITFTIDVALSQSLPLLVTSALARTAHHLKQKNIFIKHLNDCQTMGGIDNLCITKTGFITHNNLSIVSLFVQETASTVIIREAMGANTCRLLSISIIMNTLASPKFIEEKDYVTVEHIGNKTETALLQMAFKMGYHYERFRDYSKITRIYSTGVSKKKMGTVYQDKKGKKYLFVKGSHTFLVPYCSHYIDKEQMITEMNPKFKNKLNETIRVYQQHHLKIIMMAYMQVDQIPSRWSQVKKTLIFIGMVGIKDLMRDKVKKTLKQCEKAGITLRLLVQQGKQNAIGIAKQSGILPKNWIQKQKQMQLIQASEFRDLVASLARPDTPQNKHDRKIALQNFKYIQPALKIIYRASAQDKMLLATALKQCGSVVAFAGHGGNDAEALRKADVSLVMGQTGNLLAKEASDIVILDDKFQSILDVIVWGRHTLGSIQKFLVLQLTVNLVAAVLALLGAIFLGQSPLHPLQMLWINFLVDLLGSLALIFQDANPNQLIYKPYPKKQKILTQSMIKMIITQGIIQIVILTVVLFYGPQIFGIVSSVDVQQWSQQTGKHYSIFFNLFIILHIFNLINARQPNANNPNVFKDLYKSPLFLCVMLTCLIIQFVIIKYAGKSLYVTQLSFRQNFLCLVIGSMSLFTNFAAQTLMPQHFYLCEHGIQIGSSKFYWKKKKLQSQKSEPKVQKTQPGSLFKLHQIKQEPDSRQIDRSRQEIPTSPPAQKSQSQIQRQQKQALQATYQLLSPYFSKFLVKKFTTYHGYSYIDQAESGISQHENRSHGSSQNQQNGWPQQK